MPQLARGFGDFGRGARIVLSTPKTWKWMVAPFCTSALLLIAIVWVVFHYSGAVQETIAGWLPSWLDFLGTVAQWLVVGGLFLAGFFCFSAVAMLFAGPFNEFVSEVVENKLLENPESSSQGLIRTLMELIRGLFHAIRRCLVYLPTVFIAIAVGLLIPVIGPALGFLLGGFFTARAAAWDAFDAVLARKGTSYRQKADYLISISSRRLGLGLTATCMLAVPILNFVAMPIAAAAATAVYVERQSKSEN